MSRHAQTDIAVGATRTSAGVRTHDGTPKPLFRAGDTVAGRFTIVRTIGRGGMGEVYEAHDRELAEQVALKTIRADNDSDGESHERFRREIQLARRVTHVNVCRLYDFILHRPPGGPAVPLLSMELLSGETLAEFLLRCGPLKPQQALPLIRQIAAGLAAAHRAGIVHRDFKTSNVMLVPSASGELRAVVTDFGLAREPGAKTAPGQSFSGTPAYMSPEQAAGLATTTASDIYAFGIVMYEMVTDALPFSGGSSPSSVARKRLTDPPLPPRVCAPDLDPQWDAVILKCLHADPAARFATADEILHALSGEAAAPPRPQRRHTAASVTVVSMLAVGLATAYLARPIEHFPPGRAIPLTSRRTIAVLGFRDLSGRPESEWLSAVFARSLASEIVAAGTLRLASEDKIARMQREIDTRGAEGLSAETLARLHKDFGADGIVFGSYAPLGGARPGVKLDIRVQDALTGELTALSEAGAQAEVADLVARVGSRVRGALDLGALTAVAPERAELTGADAKRLFVEAQHKLRAWDAGAARKLLEQVVASNSGFAPAYSALSVAWRRLGHDNKARQLARKALELSLGLTREERLLAQARYAEASYDFRAARDAYARLFALAPDDLEYGLSLGEAQIRIGGPDAMTPTLDTLARLPPPLGDDPRIVLLRAMGHTDDFRRMHTLALEARSEAERRGLPFIAAEAALVDAVALRHLGPRMTHHRAAVTFAEQIYGAAGDEVALRSLALRAGRSIGDVDAALRFFTEVGNDRAVTLLLYHRANAHHQRGQLAAARAALDQADEQLERHNVFGDDLVTLPRTLSPTSLRAWLEYDVGNLDAARAILDGGGDRRTPDQVPITDVAPYVLTLVQQGELRSARDMVEAALRRVRKTGSQLLLASMLQARARVDHAEGRLEAARGGYEESRDILAALGIRLRQAELAEVLGEQGRFAAARQAALVVEDMYGRLGADDRVLAAATVRLRLALMQNSLPDAIKVGDRVRELAGGVESPLPRLRARIALAALDISRGELGRAAAELEEVRRLARRGGFVQLELEARLAQTGLPGDFSARLTREELQRDAEAKGFALIARRSRGSH